MGRESSDWSSEDGDFTEFVQASWPGLYRTAFMLLGDRGLAEDLAQTALTKTYTAWTRIENRSSARAYAHRTLLNTGHRGSARRAGGRRIPPPNFRRSRTPRTLGRGPRSWKRSLNFLHVNAQSSFCGSTKTYP